MARGRLRTLAWAGLAIGLAAASYPVLWRNRCLTWGATADEVAANLPGDELLPDARVVTTRAIQIGAPPDCVWPWLMQMGSGRAGDYTYDWMENLLGLDSHSADVILPQFQQVNPGDEFGCYPVGRNTIRVEIIQPPRVFVRRLSNGSWVSIYTLSGDGGTTRLVKRDRYTGPPASPPTRMAWSLLIEPGGLLIQRKLLLGIKERAERLAGELALASASDAGSLSS